MEFYYSKKKIFNTALIWVIVLVILALPIAFIIHQIIEDKVSDPLMIIALIFLIPAAIVLLGFVLKSLYFLVIPNRLLINVNEEGISLYTSKKYKSIGLIKWHEISYIKESTDNMNRPAIRITLKSHIQGQYLFYFSSKDAKKTEHTVEEVLELMNGYLLANKNQQ